MSADLTYYRLQLAIAKEKDPAIDPIDYFQRKYDLPILQIRNRPVPAFLSPPGQENTPTEYEFSHEHLEPYLRGEDDAVARAIGDHNRVFQSYYLPALITQEAYKLMDERRMEFPGGWKLRYGDDNIVAYENPHIPNSNYIGIRGTRLSDPRDIFADMNILAGLRAESFILHGLDRVVRDEILDVDPSKKWIITGHSLGASQANIIRHTFPDSINQAYLFNMGMSPLPVVGWKPYRDNQSTHYHITQDFISSPYIRDRMRDIHTSVGGEMGAEMVDGTGRWVFNPRAHSLDTFLTSSVANRMNQYIKMENGLDGVVHQPGDSIPPRAEESEGPRWKLKRRVNAMSDEDLRRNILRHTDFDADVLKTLDTHELRQLTYQLARIKKKLSMKDPLRSDSGEKLTVERAAKSREEQLKTETMERLKELVGTYKALEGYDETQAEEFNRLLRREGARP